MCAGYETETLHTVRRQDPERLVRDVACRISELRRGSGLTQERLAEAMGSSVQYVSRVEAGENLTLHTLTKIANVLKVRVIELLFPPSPQFLQARERSRRLSKKRALKRATKRPAKRATRRA